jgi:hypothetical protein
MTSPISRPDIFFGPVKAAATNDAPATVPQPFVAAEFLDVNILLRRLHIEISLFTRQSRLAYYALASLIKRARIRLTDHFPFWLSDFLGPSFVISTRPVQEVVEGAHSRGMSRLIK